MFRILVLAVLCSLFILWNGEARVVRPPVQPKTEVSQVLPEHEHDANCERTLATPVQIICILDRSGSMSSVAEDTIGGYNTFLKKQKENPDAAEVTTVLFDDEYELTVDAMNLQEVPELTSKEYFARGTTALLDAIGRTITSTVGKMQNEGICPEKRRVLVMIMTDGLENASNEYNKATVKKLIEETTEKYHWNYIFMGANMDSVKEASALGIDSRHAANFSHNRRGVEHSFDSMSRAAEDVRREGAVAEDWNE
mgnify:CR=1 FL=1